MNSNNFKLNSNHHKLECIHNQRANYANFTHTPTAITECNRCGMKNYDGTLYECYGCRYTYCIFCVPQDPVFVIDFADFIPIFCDVICKDIYMRKVHPTKKDCDECHMIWDKSEYERKCSECRNGICKKCGDRYKEEDHKHLDWENP
jgi:hypothetical protein